MMHLHNASPVATYLAVHGGFEYGFLPFLERLLLSIGIRRFRRRHHLLAKAENVFVHVRDDTNFEDVI